MDEETLKKEIDVAFEYSYEHDDWVEPLDQALEDVSARAALWRPADGKGIWDMVLHMAVWNENIVERIETGQKVHPTEGAWPAPPDEPDEIAWKAAKQRLRRSLESVRRTIAESSLDKLQASPYGIGDLLCRATHMGYHLGQIVKIRECADLPN